MRIVFIGTGEIGNPTLTALAQSPRHQLLAVVTQPDKPSGRKMELTPSPIKQLALSLQLKVFQPEKLRTPASVEQIRYLQPELIIVAAYGQILPKSLLDIPPLGCINVHASLLPKYRGAAPIQAAIAAREPQTGITIMWMDEGLDTGDILLQEPISIAKRETAQTLHDKLALLGAPALMKALPLLESKTAPRIKQNPELATLTKKIKKEDGHLAWDLEQKVIEAKIRAMSPWPSAYSWVQQNEEKKMLKIFTTIVSHHAKGAPGEVLKINRHGILVAARIGGLLLREVQLEGKKRMHAAEFARGFNLPIGSFLT